MTSALLLSDDLFVASQVNAVLSKIAKVNSVGTVEAAKEALNSGDASMLVIDLTARASKQDLDWIGELKAQLPKVVIVAFGPHVQTAKLDAAHTVGCHLVLTRGQMLRDGARLIVESGLVENP